MSKMAYRVVTEDGKLPEYEDRPYRNIFITRGEAELLRASIRQHNPGALLIIEESKLTWEVSPER